jgi:hypothetical protein
LPAIFGVVAGQGDGEVLALAGRLTDRIGIGVLARLVRRDLVDEVLAETGRREGGLACCRLMSWCIS